MKLSIEDEELILDGSEAKLDVVELWIERSELSLEATEVSVEAAELSLGASEDCPVTMELAIEDAALRGVVASVVKLVATGLLAEDIELTTDTFEITEDAEALSTLSIDDTALS
jgi:hypothetical protein